MPRIPNAQIIQQTFDLEGDEIVWRYTRRPATVTDVFSGAEYVLFLFFVLRASDVKAALRTGQWPAGAADLEPDQFNVRRTDWARSIALMDRNTSRLELVEAA